MAPQDDNKTEETSYVQLLQDLELDLRYGKMIAHPLEGEGLVISGMAGRFPESDNVGQYRENLINKVDMVTSDNRRWKSSHSEIPQRTGKINFIDKFDSAMDPVGRLLLEHSFEAILDAGVHPDELKGTRTGVFTAACIAESEKSWFYKNLKSPNFGGSGCMRSLQANWISSFFQLEGPSVSVDTACSSSLTAIDLACRSIRLGKCDAAIVGSGNLCMHPMSSLQLGVLSKDGSCKSFDKDADGYARSEAVSVIFLQKAKDARRIYAHVIHTKINCDGYKEHGITYPSGTDQKRLLSELYHECNIKPSSIDFLEAHATGTKVGDPEEVTAMDQIYCRNRNEPLHVGSVKSNHGHTEPVSGLCSVTKVLLSMEDGCFLPNISFAQPLLDPLVKGRMVVVTEPLRWTGKSGLAAINNFGFGGANAHVLLKRHAKVKSNGGIPDDDLPRLVCYSGRTQEAVDVFRNVLSQKPLDGELVALLHAIFRKPINGHTYRGFSIVSKMGELLGSSAWTNENRVDLCLVLGGPSKHLLHYAKSICQFSAYSSLLQRIQSVVSVDVAALIKDDWKKSNVNFLAASIFAQLALIDLLKLVNLRFDFICGYSSGSIAAAYADGSLTLDEVVLVTHYVIESLREYDDNSVVYQVHLTKNVIRTILPNDFEIVGHNSYRNYLIQGPPKKAKQFAEHLRTRGVAIKKTQHLEVFLKHKEQISKLYELGFNHKLENLYPQVQWPVSAKTPMISPLIKWNHTNNWFVSYFKVQENVETGESSIMFTTKETDWAFVTGHVIDKRNLLPATGYLYLVWETFSMLQESSTLDCSVMFQEVRFHRATNLSKDNAIKLFITIQRKTGIFEVAELGQVIVSGKVYRNESTMTNLPMRMEEPSEWQLSKKDIYKELKLRGYNYSGLFRGLDTCDLNITRGEIEWLGNWTAFMDNMLQIKILQVDTRNLYVPTYIDRLSINTEMHKKLLHESKIPVYVHKNADIIRSGGVEIKGLKATAIAKRKNLGEPVLESYQFVPLVAELSLENCIRVNAQIILENNLDVKFKSVELLDDNTEDPITVILQEVLGDQPLIQPELSLLTKKPLTYDRITVKDKKLSNESDGHLLVIAPGILTNTQLLQEVLDVVRDNGFMLTRESRDFYATNTHLNIITVYTTEQEKIILFQKNVGVKDKRIVDISNTEHFEWLSTLQNTVKNKEEILLLSQNDASSGVLGLINCVRREPYARKPKCVFIMDEKAPQFDADNQFYSNQLRKGLSINVYKNGRWGTYRHLLMEQNQVVKREHIFNNVLTTGDLSSLTWLEGPLTSTTKMQPEKTLVNIMYSALNFRDIMTASGRIQGDVITTNRVEQQIIQGFEFSGTLANGKRVMGLVKSGALASMAITNSYMITKIPDQWTFEEAATVTVTYCTALLSLEVIGRIRPGQSILIHAGTGGIGLSAINIAQYYKCNIFTTVGTLEKKNYILKHFPAIPETHVGNSRDTSFEQLIMKKTNGKGVDIILNSLAEEKLQATARCLAPRGKFLEIGKFDLQNNNKLKINLFANGCSYHSVMLDMFFDENPSRQALLLKLLHRGIKGGYVKPLKRTVFEKKEIEQAFRYMAGGKHIGKVLVKIRDEGIRLFEGIPRFYCNEDFCSVIIGGLGGFGLELADWLVLRGCKKLVLVSRSGLKNGYEASKILNWKTYGVSTCVSTADVTTKEGCVALLEEATKLGPVESIFNLAVVLKDAVFENQTVNNFEISFAPKATATKHLDEVSRRLCPDLKKFVVFSSVVCGRGNAGQSNYGMANSVMERICENRRSDGYPGLAIQWGAIGDVGLVADMQELHQEIEIGGTLQQRIGSCLSVLDTFLNQDEAVVSSMVVAEKKGSTTGSGSVVDVVMNIIGIKDLKSVGIHTSLSSLGMDSIMAVEIKQTLEREYDAIVTPQDIRSFTFANASKHDAKYEMLYLFILNVAEEVKELAPVVRLKSLVPETTSAPCVFVLPGVDGKHNVVEPLAANLACHVFCVQYDYADPFKTTVENTANYLLLHLQDFLAAPTPFTIVAYSLSCVVAVQLVSLLEQQGRTGRLILIDGSPSVFQQLVASQVPDIHDENVFQSYVVGSFAKSYLTLDQVLKIKPDLLECQSLEERIDLVMKYLPNSAPDFVNYQRQVITSGYGRVRSATLYEPAFKKLNTVTTLIKPDQPLLPNLPNDYNVQGLCQSPVQIYTFEGNHLSILKNSKLASTINSIVKDNWEHFKDGGTVTKNVLNLQRTTDLRVKQI
ncbi:hypothetical protein RN001_010623 [Aquatica leii]|uniref:Uncharacterized protein n=1 Tax=Aquatica leii TaxID=1421715 RepID=A0AAN7SEJ8_9COLE|nr:hypothetical protein RN001_010623 [Aquatica leii]